MIFQSRIDRQAAETVLLYGKGRGERMGAHAGAPHDRRRLDALAVLQRRARGIDRGDRHTTTHFDTQRLVASYLDDRHRFRAHIGADARGVIGQDNAGRGDTRGAQLARHLGRRLDARQPAADDQHGRSTRTPNERCAALSRIAAA